MSFCAWGGPSSGGPGHVAITSTPIPTRDPFRYEMHTLPDEIGATHSAIGTSTLLAAWNAATYVAQVEDHRLAQAMRDNRYLEATTEVLRRNGGLWYWTSLRHIAQARRSARRRPTHRRSGGIMENSTPATTAGPPAISASIVGAGDGVSELVRGFSIEITSRSRSAVAACRDGLEAGTQVYIAAIPGDVLSIMRWPPLARSARLVLCRSRIFRPATSRVSHSSMTSSRA